MDRLLLTGASGQLGRYFCAGLGGVELFPVAYRNVAAGLLSVDLTDEGACIGLIGDVKPDIVIHAAAFADVDGCEKDPGKAWTTNVLATRNLVNALTKARSEARLVYLSTDQVYPGPGPSREDKALPAGVYALTKMWGEDAALAFGNALAVRTNFVAAGTPGRLGLADWLVKSLSERRPVILFDDVLFNPLYAGDLPRLLLSLARSGERGVVNLGCSGLGLSKAAFARGLAKRLSLSLDSAKNGKLTDAALAAQRSPDTRMDVARAERVLGTPLPHAEMMMDRMADDIRQRGSIAA